MKTNNRNGFSLIELLIVMGIFAVVMAGLYAAYSVQLKQGVKQYRSAESEMELQIAKTILQRDLALAGYGLAEDYGTATGFTVPRAASATIVSEPNPDTDPDDLVLMGTAVGIGSRAAQGWTCVTDVDGSGVPTFRTWSDAREDVRDDPLGGTKDDIVIVLEPYTRKLRLEAGTDAWLFQYNGNNAKLTKPGGTADITNALTADDTGALVYGLYTAGETAATQPYYAVRYYLASGTMPKICAAGTQNLVRAESRTDPAGGTGQPLLNCVLDFQMAFGLDTDDDDEIECWDNGGITASFAKDYTPEDLNKRLKQLRVYALVQDGNRDEAYVYANPDPLYASTPDKVLVGDSGLIRCGGAGTVGRVVQLTSDQRNYRWRVLAVNVTPRNMR